MRRRAGIERRIEILAKCSAKCCLKAAVDRYLLQHGREEVARRGVENLGQRSRLGLDPGEFGARFLQGRTRCTFGGTRFDDRLFGGIRRRFGGFQRRLRLFGEQLLLGRIGKPGDALGDLGGLAVDSRELPLEPLAPLGRFTQGTLDLVARGGGLGPFGRQLRKRRFAQCERCRGGLESGTRRGLALQRGGILLIERCFFRIEPLQYIRIVADHLLFARDVGVELFEATCEFRTAALDARGLFLDLRLGDGEALIGGGGGSFGIAQFRQAMGADRLFLRGLHLGAGALADDRCRRRQRRLRLAPPAPWRASSARAAASPRPCGCRPTGS